jgi:hypothetical protein
MNEYDEYDEYEVIDADTKRRLGTFDTLEGARHMAHAIMSFGRLRPGIIVITKTREQVETVIRTSS